MEDMCEEAERLDRLRDKMQTRVSTLDNLLSSYWKYTHARNDATTLVNCLGKMVQNIETLFYKQDLLKKGSVMLERILKNIYVCNTTLERLPDTTGFDEAYTRAQKLMDDKKHLESERFKMQNVLTSATSIQQYIVKTEKDIMDFQEEFDSLMPAVCPLCQQEVRNENNSGTKRRNSR
jgi:uncharacterized membrane protein YgaE (UPF0421/DUF939 family)